MVAVRICVRDSRSAVCSASALVGSDLSELHSTQHGTRFAHATVRNIRYSGCTFLYLEEPSGLEA